MPEKANLYLSRLPWERTNCLAGLDGKTLPVSGAPAQIFEVITTHPARFPKSLRHPLKPDVSRVGHLTVFFVPHKRTGVLALCYLLFFIPVTVSQEQATKHPLVQQVMEELLDFYSREQPTRITEWIFTVARGLELTHFGLTNRFPSSSVPDSIERRCPHYGW